MTCAINFAKAWFHVDKRHTWDHLVDASIRTMKYLNGPNKVWMGPQMPPWMLSRNFSGSARILRCDGLKINFPVAHEVHTKYEDSGNFLSLIQCPLELLMIFLIIPMPGCLRRSCQVLNASTFWKNHFVCNMWYEFDVCVVQSRRQRRHFSSVCLPYPVSLVKRRNSSFYSSCVSTWIPFFRISL
jgi:hypothetical protein